MTTQGVDSETSRKEDSTPAVRYNIYSLNRLGEDPEITGTPESGAVFQTRRDYRYALWRKWDPSKPSVLFVLLNPSIADEKETDPTLTRCLNFAKNWDYGEMFVGNLYALRATHPAALAKAKHPTGPLNDKYLELMQRRCHASIVGWGNGPSGLHSLRERALKVNAMLSKTQQVMCLGRTNKGRPVHPLRVEGDKKPIPFQIGRSIP